MDHKSLLQKLQHIMETPFEINGLQTIENAKFKAEESLGEASFIVNDRLYFHLSNENQEQPLVISVPAHQVSASERALIEWIITSMQSASPMHADHTTEQSNMNMLGAWIIEQIDSSDAVTIPEGLDNLTSVFRVGIVPFYITYEGGHDSGVAPKSMYKLLQSYFGGEIMLVLLQQDKWLVLAEEAMVLDRTELKDVDQGAERTELALESELMAFAEGLYEVVANEWVGVFNLSVHSPLYSLDSLPHVTSLLMETIQLGKIFRMSEHVHFPWRFTLERLVSRIPEEQRSSYLNEVKDSSILFDEETISTLEIFFQLDCNVSETAKRLYIHRNTLIYRLDKIKQETGLDVRSFKDAVLVKLTLLLYKVTKRL
ncbi:helix-turn-helix domain-containing protein [Paenibacillus sp. 453mf]|uniref:PucR family transcriptional regulator n=1 Tax=Paenibacillus sp. 453mf TaxID=1761874 RepID=UPI0008F3E175|nr:helix-turn-helix domain-containing protein [Paenibacillus sp. 453mf]SFS97005.1 PucR C-terminal helix-turn-helix domain-containing protein [Paenibacillus sp. 453mf]